MNDLGTIEILLKNYGLSSAGLLVVIVLGVLIYRQLPDNVKGALKQGIAIWRKVRQK